MDVKQLCKSSQVESSIILSPRRETLATHRQASSKVSRQIIEGDSNILHNLDKTNL